MRNILAALLVAVSALGCANRPVDRIDYERSNIQQIGLSRVNLSSDIGVARYDLQKLTERLQRSTSPDELANLQAEIDLLKKKLQELEEKMAGLPAIEKNPNELSVAPAYRSGAGPVYTGPRGGRYTISPSGKKSYIRRK